MLPSCPFSSTCVTPGISRHTHYEGEPFICILAVAVGYTYPCKSSLVRRVSLVPVFQDYKCSASTHIINPTQVQPRYPPPEGVMIVCHGLPTQWCAQYACACLHTGGIAYHVEEYLWYVLVPTDPSNPISRIVRRTQRWGRALVHRLFTPW